MLRGGLTMGLDPMKDKDAAQAKKDKHAKNTTMEQRMQAVEHAVGLR